MIRTVLRHTPLIGLAILAVACSSLSPAWLPGLQATPTLVSGAVLFQDDFSNPLSGWDRIAMPGGVMDYDSGIYRFLIHDSHFNYWSTPRKRFRNARIEVDVAKLAGPDINRAGLICRLNYDQFYFFVISSDGYYAIGRTHGLDSYLIGQDQMAPSPHIHTGMAVNHLRADCVEDTLTFYVNGFLLAQVTDTTLSEGEVGLLVGTFDEGSVDVIFDRFIVMQP